MERLLGEIRAVLKPGARFLIAEPKRHVKPAQFEEIIVAARAAGFAEEGRPEIRMSMSVLFRSSE
jgi:hypothetical protein